MICEYCGDPIQDHEEKVLAHFLPKEGAQPCGNAWHQECRTNFLAARRSFRWSRRALCRLAAGRSPEPEPSELELAYRRGDEMETVRRMGRDLIGRIQRDFDALVRESAKVMAERDSALRRCKELEEMARRRSPNPPEGAEVHNV